MVNDDFIHIEDAINRCKNIEGVKDIGFVPDKQPYLNKGYKHVMVLDQMI